MAKLTYEDKKEIVRLYEDERLGCQIIAKKFNVSNSTINIIIRKYHIHGEESIEKNKNRTYSPEFKLEVITRALNGESKTSLIIEYDISKSQIISWLNNYEKLGYDGLVNKPKGRPTSMKKEENKTLDINDKDTVIEQLKKENYKLQCEVDALKKLRALVLQRNTQQIKKKQK